MMKETIQDALLSGTKMHLVGDLDPDFLCTCQQIIAKPKMCPTCDSLFCERCSKEIEICPKCEATVNLRDPPKFLTKQLQKLEFECDQREQCGMSCEYSEALTHICPFEEIACSSEGCSDKLNRADLEQHLAICSFYRFICPNPGCEMKLKRKDKVEHVKSCRFRLVVCDICQQQMKITEFTDHEKNCYLELCPKCKMQIIGGEAHDCLQNLGNMFKTLAENQRTLIGFVEKESGLTKSKGSCTICKHTKQSLIYSCPKCHSAVCLKCFVRCHECKRIMCQECVKSSKLPEITYQLCAQCAIECSSGKHLEIIPIHATSEYGGGYYNLSQTVSYLPDFPNAHGAGCYWCSGNLQNKKESTQDLIYKVKGGKVILNQVTVKPHMSYPFQKMKVYVGKERDSYQFQTGQFNCQFMVKVCFPEMILGEFVKITLSGCSNTWMGIYEVRVFGVGF